MTLNLEQISLKQYTHVHDLVRHRRIESVTYFVFMDQVAVDEWFKSLLDDQFGKFCIRTKIIVDNENVGPRIEKFCGFGPGSKIKYTGEVLFGIRIDATPKIGIKVLSALNVKYPNAHVLKVDNPIAGPVKRAPRPKDGRVRDRRTVSKKKVS